MKVKEIFKGMGQCLLLLTFCSPGMALEIPWLTTSEDPLSEEALPLSPPDNVLSGDLPPAESEDVIGDLMRSLLRGTSDDVVSSDATASEDAEGNIDENLDPMLVLGGMVEDPSTPFDATPYDLEGRYVILQEESGALTDDKNHADGRTDLVRLVALRKSDGIYDRALLFEIIPPAGAPYIIPLSADLKGYDTKIELWSFRSPNTCEILLSVKTGAFDTLGRFVVFAIEGEKAEALFDSKSVAPPTVKGFFLNGFRAEMGVEETGEGIRIDLSSRKTYYESNRTYNELSGSLRNAVKIKGDRYSRLQPADVDDDGVNELKVVVDAVGINRSDVVAYVEATLKYDGKGKKWKVLDSWIAPAEDLRNISPKLPN